MSSGRIPSSANTSLGTHVYSLPVSTSAFSTDFSSKTAVKGDKITAHISTLPAVQDYDATTGFNNMGHVGVGSDPTGMFVNKCSGILTIGDGTKFEDTTCPSNGSWLHNGTMLKVVHVSIEPLLASLNLLRAGVGTTHGVQSGLTIQS